VSTFAGSAAAAGLLRMPAPAGDTHGSHSRLPTVAEQQRGGP
jgi:hypothetical protein